MAEFGELLIAQVWNSQQFQQPLLTSAGHVFRVVYPGVWTHGFGPDFRGAMLDFDGVLHTGDVEIDLDVSGWHQHGHDRNPDFNDVILQVVARASGADLVRRSDGGMVPRVVLTDYLEHPLQAFSGNAEIRPLGAIGFDSCAPHTAEQQPELIRETWQRAGDQRMQEKVATISGELTVSTPTQVLYERILDALGFSRNRAPMVEVAARLPIDQLQIALDEVSGPGRFWRAAALLLGIGGFLPLSPPDSAIADLEARQIGRLESEWLDAGEAWHGIEISPGSWSLARIRPAAHPVRRLLAAAQIVSGAPDGLLSRLVASLAGGDPRREVMAWLAGENPWLGNDHAHELAVNVVIPFGLAYGEHARQPSVFDAAANLWQRLPAGRGNAVTRATRKQICGDISVPPRSARAEQGLIHINRHGCSQMRCYECPIAMLALSREGETVLESESL